MKNDIEKSKPQSSEEAEELINEIIAKHYNDNEEALKNEDMKISYKSSTFSITSNSLSSYLSGVKTKFMKIVIEKNDLEKIEEVGLKHYNKIKEIQKNLLLEIASIYEK